MARDQGDIWVLPSGIQLGFRVSQKAPIVCMVCLNAGRDPREFNSIDEFVHHLVKEHKEILRL